VCDCNQGDNGSDQDPLNPGNNNQGCDCRVSDVLVYCEDGDCTVVNDAGTSTFNLIEDEEGCVDDYSIRVNCDETGCVVTDD
jgi:hypothetical protein